MAYTLPTFNLTCFVWRNGNATTNPPDVTVACNLAFGRREAPSAGITAPGVGVTNYMFVLFPKLADVRDHFCPAGFDTIEVPAASGRFYDVSTVDDIGKGFSNEHRVAMVSKTGVWPEPIP